VKTSALLGHSHGFTFVELLAVIAILAIIGAVVALNVGNFFASEVQISQTASYTIYVLEEGVQKNLGITIFGDVLIRYPRGMNIGDSREVSLTLIPPSNATSESDVAEQPTNQGTYYVVSDKVQFYSVMHAELNAVNFGISSTSTQYKEVSPTSKTEWVWIITPNAVGEQLLRVELSTPVRVQGYEESVSRAVYSQQIQISVKKPFNWRSFLEDWRNILGTVIGVGAVVGLVLRLQKVRKHRKHEKLESDTNIKQTQSS
jgi:prepilin-type N-terminal cleavage/methylation domain-containing protein